MGITITKPATRKKVQLGQAVEFVGTAALGTARVDLTADDGRVVLPTVTLNRRQWFVASRFNEAGIRRIVARAFDTAGTEIGRAEVEVEVGISVPMAPPPDFGALVPIPAGINTGVSAAKQQTMLNVFGRPCSLSADCTGVTNPKVRALLVTRNVGPFSVTGIRPAVDALQRIFTRVKAEQPDVFRVVGTAGVLCCRRVRRASGPPSPNFSNHSWGTAIDLTIKSRLDPRGDGKTQLGVALLAPFFNAERFFWGAGFRGASEDAMHFEASDELVRDWQRQGILG
ncbi:MAG TPA: M15 family metallopeptidase [Longimicrobiaceae bacterium]|nr:M15 family metallopeptidase [Longimicrobiaceae bacterium]